MDRRAFFRSSLAALLFLAALALLFVPSAVAETLEDVVRSYVGQKRILRHLGENFGERIKRKDLGKLKDGCDLPVEILEVNYQKNEVRIRMERIGTLVWQGKTQACGRVWRSRGEVTISGFDRDISPDVLCKELDALLQTPDAFLTAQGAALPTPAGSDPLEPVMEMNPQTARVAGFVAPRALLSVNAAYPEAARFYKRPGIVLVRFLVGTDGRAYNARIVKAAGYGMEEQTLRVLDLFRFEPAQKEGLRVAMWTTMEMNFRIF